MISFLCYRGRKTQISMIYALYTENDDEITETKTIHFAKYVKKANDAL